LYLLSSPDLFLLPIRHSNLVCVVDLEQLRDADILFAKEPHSIQELSLPTYKDRESASIFETIIALEQTHPPSRIRAQGRFDVPIPASKVPTVLRTSNALPIREREAVAK
jgi:hypothetical protein